MKVYYDCKIDKYSEEKHIFKYSQNSDTYNEKKKIMKIFLELVFELMTEKEKIVYKMRNEDNLKHEEIANILNISVSNSKVLLSRANSKISRISGIIEEIKKGAEND